MGISWGLETRVRELFAIECLSCSLLPPQKNQKNFFQKSESQEIPDTKLKKKSRRRRRRRKKITRERERKKEKGRHKDETSTNHHLGRNKKNLVLGILSRLLFK